MVNLKSKSNKIRPNLFDDIIGHSGKNLYCNLNDLSNEASVETFFMMPFLSDLGYANRNIKTKESISKLKLAKGSKSYLYSPDYCLVWNKNPRVVVDAKSPNENIYDFTNQCIHYCLLLNEGLEKDKADYYILSNGIKTALFLSTSSKPIVELDFYDFKYGNKKYEKFRSIVAFDNIKNSKITKTPEQIFKLKPISKEDAQKLFLTCHKYIWKAEKRSPSSAFMEFMKIIFVKLYHDRKIHVEYKDISEYPKSAVTFSVHWIESRENETANPINDLHFKKLLEEIQDEIDAQNKKRIFDIDEQIKLKPQTLKAIVKKIETFDLYGIDEDLNGRLFETFLNATMRGRELGQFFTPRSIVLLSSYLADLQVNELHQDTIIDPSCGTGGFLIEALTIMRQKIRDNKSYSIKKKTDLIKKICDECFYGIDAATDPELARIARINMYLHGDGGSRIYRCDGLDNDILIDKSETRENQKELQEFKERLNGVGGFDVILTNPPFSMWYELENEDEARILHQYEVAKIDATSIKVRSRLRGSALFIERYRNLLKAGGKVLTIVDESIIANDDWAHVRDFIRKYFIIRAVISLPGDAFKMSGARVKTSLIYLEKKKDINDIQPDAFMYASVYLGVDDLPIMSSKQKIEEARKLANEEIETICLEFNKFSNGEESSYSVDSSKLQTRLDVKFCAAKNGRLVKSWKKQGFEVIELSTFVENQEDIIISNEHPEAEYRILTITYKGRAKISEIRKGKDINYSTMKVVKKGDLVFSTYNSINGAISYITDEFEGSLASANYTVVRCNNDFDTVYLWSLMRSTEMRAEMQAASTGMGRQFLEWIEISKIKIPLASPEKRKEIGEKILLAWNMETQIKSSFNDVEEDLNNLFNVESEASKLWYLSNRPPK
jgi:type I restriction enzyme M protein